MGHKGALWLSRILDAARIGSHWLQIDLVNSGAALLSLQAETRRGEIEIF